MKNKIKFNCELTDTFGGEANYSWVRRKTITVDADASDRTIVTRAKKALELTGVDCKRESFGETIVLRPIGVCWVAFITFNEGGE